MAGRNSTWPVFLKLEADGSVGAKMDAFKRQVGAGFADVGKAGAAAGRRLDDSINFTGANRRLDELGRKMKAVLSTAATGQFTPIDRSARNDPLAVRNTIGTRAGTARSAFIEARAAGATAAEATNVAARAVGNLNASYALMERGARKAGIAAVGFGGRTANAFSVAAGAAGVFQGALGGVASRLGFLGQLFNTIGAKGTLAIAALAGGGALIGAGAQLQNYQNLLRSTTGSQAEFAAAQEATSRIALASRTSLSDTIQSYAKLSINSKELGLSSRELEQTLITVQQAIQLSGSNAQETSAAMLQFGQALASNKLAGDEFRSLGENATKVLQTIRLGLEKTGDVKGFDGTIESFRALSKAGELTGSVVSRALLAMGQVVNQQFQAMPVTITQAQTKISNAFLEIGLSVEQVLHPLAGTAAGLNAIADNMGVLGAVAGGLGAALAVGLAPKLVLAALSAARGVVEFVRLTTTLGFAGAAAKTMGGATGLLSGALSFMLTPAGAAAIAIGAIAAAAIYFAQQGSVAEQAARGLGVSMEELRGKSADAAAALRDASFAARELAGIKARALSVEKGQLTIFTRDSVRAQTRNIRLYAGGPLTQQGRALGSALDKFDKGGSAEALLRDAKAAGVAGKAYERLAQSVDDYQVSSKAFHIAEKQRHETLKAIATPPAPRRSSGGGGAGVGQRTLRQAQLESVALANAGNTLKAAGARYARDKNALLTEIGGAKGYKALDPTAKAAFEQRLQALDAGYAGEVASIKAGEAAKRSAKTAGNKAAREAAAAAKAHGVNEGQQALADGKLLGSASDALAQAQARYSAAIVAIRNKQQEHKISDAGAKQAAAAAQAELIQAKASIEAADNLAAAYQRIQSEFDGEPKFIDKIQKARADVALLQKQIDEGGVGQTLLKDGTIVSQDSLDKTKRGIEDSLVKPIQDAGDAIRDNIAVQALMLQGREGEAEFLRQSLDLLHTYGKIDGADLDTVNKKLAGLKQQTEEQFRQNRALEARNKIVDNLVQNAENVQSALTGVLAQPFKADSYKNLFNTVLGDFQKTFFDSLSTQLFGNLGQGVSDLFKRQNDPLGAAGDRLTDSAIDQHNAAAALVGAAGNLNSAASALGGSAGPTAGQVGTTPTAFGLGSLGASLGRTIGGPIGNLISTFTPLLGNLGGSTPAAGNFDLGRAIDIQTSVAKESLQVQQSDPLRTNPVQAYNLFGAAVGKRIDNALGTGGIFGKIGGKLGTVLQGISIGQQTGQLPALLGLKTSKFGSALGGAIGGLIAGPLGAAIGGFLGSIAGGLLKKTKKGSTSIGANQYGNLDIVGQKGNSAKRKAATKSDANNIIDTLESLAHQFGVELLAELGAVSIGIKKDKFYVDPTGQGRTKGAGVVKFGKDEKAAIEFAIRNLIEDGVLKGIRAGTKKLLLNSRSLESGIAKALKFENVFKDLKRLTDPVGAAIDELDIKFNELRRIFAEAGATVQESIDLERLYGLERSEAIKSAAKDLTSTLADLLKELTYSGDTGLSLRTRQTNAQAAFSPYQQQIQAGQAVDQEGFAEAAKALLEIQRQIYGSTSAYFDSLSLITALTRQAITNAGGVPAVTGTTAVTAAAAPYASPTPGVSTVAPGAGAPVSNLTAIQTAANDNAVAAQTIVQAIRDETNALVPLLSQDSIVNAIQGALLGLGFKTDVFGGLTQAVLTGNNQVTGGLSQLVGLSGQNLEESRNFRTTISGLTADHWSNTAGAGSAYSGTNYASGGRSSPFGAPRLQMSISGF